MGELCFPRPAVSAFPALACEAVPEDGGRDRDRTCDPFHVKEVLFR